ncbi:LbetaH domain-containing protein [Devosia aurantiaca]|uniref:putative colanic acid biosynthesis acetyltransferase n=1 Tax=Devosia aurantiaca TaxID=2714858 RepID=UPI001A9870D1|nr:putative colanic acid biosynthesis acetyltransferase [Devosia aurantiaca]
MPEAASFSLRHRLLRAAFMLTWLVLARWTPPTMRKWRNLILRLFGAHIHPSAQVYGSAQVWYPPNLSMAAESTLGPRVICYCMAPVSIAERAVISQRSHLCAGTHDIDDPDFLLRTLPISIGAEAWIAAEAFVGPGVTVGARAVLGARGVTVKDLEAGASMPAIRRA